MILQSLKILILEDSETDAEIIVRIVNKNYPHCQCKVAMEKEPYIELLKNFQPNIILSDNAMPNFSAAEALALLHQSKINIPFILVTGTVSEEFAASIIKAGADDYLLKDRLARLPAAIEAALKQKQTEREKAESIERLEQSEKRFRALVENNEGIISLVDEKLNVLFRSASAARITGWTNEEYDKINVAQYIHPNDVQQLAATMAAATKEPGKTFDFSIRVQHKNGHYLWFEGVVKNMIHDPAIGGIVTNMRDVTERKEAEKKNLKANRLYLFISQINQMIVRTTDETTLFKEACDIAVNLGKFKMAWIGLIDNDTKNVVPVMHAGEEKEYLSVIKTISADDIPSGRGPIGTAIREGKYIVCNDIENDPKMSLWKEEALARGYHSLMALPIKKFGKTIGAFSFNAAEKDFFDAEEIALLEEATSDVSFALEVLERETMRKKAEEAVLESEQRYQILAEVSPVGIFHTDAKGFTTYVNPYWCQISGLTFEQALGNGWLNAVHPNDKNKLIDGWKNATNNKEHSLSEYRFVRPDGTIAWVIGQAIPEKNAENKIVGYVGTITDITERIVSEKQILKQKELSDSIINNLPGIFYLYDEKGDFIRWNKNFETLTGYSGIEIKQMHPVEFYDIDIKDEVAKRIKTVFKKDVPGIELELLTKQKTKIPVYINSWTVEYEGKKCLLGIGTNLSEIKKAAEEIKKSNERYRSLLDNLEAGVVVHAADTSIINFNTKASQLLGLKEDEMIGKRAIDTNWKFLYEDDTTLPVNQYPVNIIKVTKQSIKNFTVGVSRPSIGDVIWLIVNGFPVFDINGTITEIVISFIDITVRKKAAEEIRTANARYETIAAATNDAVFDIDLLTGIGVHNKSFLQLFNFDNNSNNDNREMWRSKLHPDDKERVIKKIETAYSGNLLTWSDEFRFKKADGTYGVFYDRASIIRDDLGKAVRLIGSMVEITELKTAEEKVLQQKVQLETLSNNLPGVMIYQVIRDLGNRMNFTYISKGVTALTGKQPEEVLENPVILYDIIHKEDIQKLITAERESLSTMKSLNEEVRCVNYEGNIRWLNIVSTPRKLNDGRTVWDGFHLDITERKISEQEIESSEEKRKLIMNAALDAIICIDTRGEITFWNPMAEKIFGWQEAEVMGKLLSEIIIPEAFRKMHDKGIENYLETGVGPALNVLLELKAINRQSNEFPIELTVLPIKQGGEEFFCAFIRDISERKKAQQAIKISEEKYRSLVEQASDAIFISDEKGRFVTVNPSACKISQYTEAELLQMSIFDFFIAEDVEKKPIQLEALQQGKTITSERIMKRKDGGVNYLEITAKLLNDGRLLSFVRDIADRIKAQNEIIKEKNLSDSIINSLPGIFYLYNKAGKFLRWNINFETVSGYSGTEISKMHPLDFYGDDEKELMAKKISNTFLFGEENVQANFLIKTQEKIPYYFTGILIEYEGQPCLMGVGIDFSEKIKAQDEIKQTSEKLRQLTAHLQRIREDERKRIGREIHDELGQQLTAIKMDAAWIDKKMPDQNVVVKNKLKNILQLLDGSNQSIRRILNELRPGILEDYGLLEALKWVNRQFIATTGIPVKFNSKPITVKISEEISTCIFRVYQEAFTNITRYANAKNVITALSINKNEVAITIKDNGEGFDAIAAKSKNTFGILGMKERVLSLGGKFELITHPGSGTEINISIPIII